MGGKLWKRYILGTMAQVLPGYTHDVKWRLHITVLVLDNDY